MDGSSAGKPRVLVVDGDVATRQTIARQLTENGAFDVVGTAINARTALPKTASYRPDVLTVDLVSAEVEGLSLAETLRRQRTPIGLVLMVGDTKLGDALRARAELAPCEVVLRSEATAAFERCIVPAVQQAANAFARATPIADSEPRRSATPPTTTPHVPVVAHEHELRIARPAEGRTDRRLHHVVIVLVVPEGRGDAVGDAARALRREVVDIPVPVVVPGGAKAVG